MPTKTTNYFSHDAGARNDSKVLRLRMRHGAEGYGVFFMLLERLREESDYTCPCDYEMLAFDFHASEELVRSVVEDFGLFAFTEDGTSFYSESFLTRMSVKDEMSRKRAESGKRGLEKRWNSKPIANATEADSKVIANATDADSKPIANVSQCDSNKSKGKESKESKERIPPPPSARARKAQPAATAAVDTTDWYNELMADRTFIQTLAVQTHSPDEATIVQALRDFDAEITAKAIHHANAADYRRHAYDWIRIHLEHQQRNATATANLQAPHARGETDDDFKSRIVRTVAAAAPSPDG